MRPEQRWYFERDDRRWGPVTGQELFELMSEGRVNLQTRVWCEGLEASVPLREAEEAWEEAGLQPPGGFKNRVPMPVAPAYHADGTPLVLNYGTKETGHNYAGFWLRFVAFIIDVVVLQLLWLILSVWVFVILNLFDVMEWPALQTRLDAPLWAGLALVYWAGMESSRWQATLGKLAMGLIVTDLNGASITLSRAAARFALKLLSWMTLWIGFLMASFTEKKQALHDMIAGTLVVRGSR